MNLARIWVPENQLEKNLESEIEPGVKLGLHKEVNGRFLVAPPSPIRNQVLIIGVGDTRNPTP